MAAVVGPDRAESIRRATAGQPVPAVWLTGVIDTGTIVTCVAASVLQKLALAPSAHSQSQTVSGPVSASLFDISITIPPASRLPGSDFTLEHLQVMELAQPIPNVEMLIGMDIILLCKLLIDGPGGSFVLEF